MAGVVGFVSLLEVLTRTALIPGRLFPPPSATLTALARELPGPTLWRDLGSTLAGWAVGLSLALAIAVPLGIALGSGTLAVELPKPRDQVATRALAEFSRLRGEVHRLIRRENQAGSP